MSKNLKITLIKSFYGCNPKHRVTVRTLGLKRLHQSVVHPNNPCIQGMIRQISYLLKVEENS